MRTDERFYCVLSAVLAAGIGTNAPAEAQVVDARFDLQSVRDRARPEYDALGVPVGSFTFLPSAQVNTGYDSNVRALASPAPDDFTLLLRSIAVLRSDWIRNSLVLRASMEAQRFAKRPVENAEQYSVGANGRIDVDSRTRLTSDALFGRLIESRGSIGDTSLTGSPIVYHQYRTGVGGDHDFGTLQLRGNFVFDEYHYQRRTSGTQAGTQGGRNYRGLTGDVRLNASILQTAGVFVRGTVSRSAYLQRQVTNTDSTSYGTTAGIAFGITPLLYGSAGIGYYTQRYDDATLPSTDGLDYSASIFWNPTSLISSSLVIDRSVQRAPNPTLGGAQATTATLTADYELRRNLLINGTAVYSNYYYGLVDRSQHQVSASSRLTYLMNRQMSGSLLLIRSRQRPNNGSTDTSAPGLGRRYDRTQITLGLRLQM